MYLAAVPSRRRGLRRLGQLPGTDLTPLVNDWLGPTPPTLASGVDAPSACSWWDFFFNSAAWNTCLQTSQNSQIASVVTNANTFYGAGSPVSVAAAQAAAQQESATPSDAANNASYFGAGSLLYNVQQPNPSGLPTWAWYAVIGIGALVVIKVVR